MALPVVLLAAGVLFATSAETSQGSDLRGGRREQLAELIRRGNSDVGTSERRAADLRRSVDEATRAYTRTDARLKGPQQDVDELTGPAGLGKVRGPSLTVKLDDAPRRPGGVLPVGATADDVVVHQQDVQAVVNALWAGGAEAMTIMGIRVISTSAVRCVGNTLLLHGRTFSPAFVITAIGNVSSMRAALEASPGVSLYRQAARAWNLGYTVGDPQEVTLPAYSGPTGLTHATNPNR
ncbi:DUF881 domain-containing protein [Cryptosporangium phraense]|uniref:DUF881 domain-containing protein n=1 Tax=Cryptosporangium phraense TaxID=2593070 RepID=UPI00197AC374|nr:DUF881 domain-containing protein [Cryptosporangium phraense]